MGLVLLVGCVLVVMYHLAKAFQEELPDLQEEAARSKAELSNLEELLQKQRVKLAQLSNGEL